MERTALFDILKANIRTVSPSTANIEIQESHDIYFDVGLDSLEAVEVVSRTIRHTKIQLPLTAIARISTIHELLDLFQRNDEKSDHLRE